MNLDKWNRFFPVPPEQQRVVDNIRKNSACIVVPKGITESQVHNFLGFAAVWLSVDWSKLREAIKAHRAALPHFELAGINNSLPVTGMLPILPSTDISQPLISFWEGIVNKRESAGDYPRVVTFLCIEILGKRYPGLCADTLNAAFDLDPDNIKINYNISKLSRV